MAFELKDNSGSMFKNQKKEKDTHPDMTGTALIGGKVYWVSGWKKTDKNDNTWISFAVKEKDLEEAKPKEAPKKTADELEDEIPF